MPDSQPYNAGVAHFQNSCRYLSQNRGTCHDIVLEEVCDMIADVPMDKALIASALLSGEVRVLDALASRPDFDRNALLSRISSVSFWQSLPDVRMRSGIVERALSLTSDLDPAPLERNAGALARKAVLLDQPSLLEALVNRGVLDQDSVRKLLTEESSILNSGPGCASAVYRLMTSANIDTIHWDRLFMSSLSKGHWKTVMVLVRSCVVSDTARLANTAITEGRVPGSMPYFLASNHAILETSRTLPDALEILATPRHRIDQMVRDRSAAMAL